MPAHVLSRVTVHVPAQLRKYCGGERTLEVFAGNVRRVLEELEDLHPDLHRCIRDETGAVRRHVNLFVNADNVRDLAGLDTPVKAGDVVMILPAVSGG